MSGKSAFHMYKYFIFYLPYVYMCVYNISTCDEPVRGLQCLVNLCMAQVLTRMRIERLESQCSRTITMCKHGRESFSECGRGDGLHAFWKVSVLGLSLCANTVERAFQNVGPDAHADRAWRGGRACARNPCLLAPRPVQSCRRYA